MVRISSDRRRLETHYRHMQYIKGGSFLHIFALLLTAFQDAYDIYQVFSSGSHPALWRALPVFEQLLSAWENKQKSSRFVFYYDALSDGLDKLKKYYSRFDYKPVYVLALGKSCHVSYHDANLMHCSFTSLLQNGVYQEDVRWRCRTAS